MADLIRSVSHFITMSDFTGEVIAEMLPDNLLDVLHLRPRDIDEARKDLEFDPTC